MMQRIYNTISRYLFREMLSPFLINLLFFTFIFLMAKILDITNLVVNYGIGFFNVFQLLACAVPSFMVYVLPMATMMAVLLAFLRLSSDNEIVAIKACGISMYRLLPAVLFFCTFTALLTFFIAVYGQPLGHRAAERLMAEEAARNLDAGIKKRVFINRFKGIVLYVNDIDLQKRLMLDVFVEEKKADREISTIIAPKARFYGGDAGEPAFIRFYDGVINQSNPEKRAVNFLRFQTYDLRVRTPYNRWKADMAEMDRKEMTLREMMRFLVEKDPGHEEYGRVQVELHRRFAIPVACFVLGFLAMPLGIQSRSAKKSYGLGLGLFFFLVYYVLLAAGMTLGEEGKLPPLIGMWVPNLLVTAAGLLLFFYTVKDQSLEKFLLPFTFLRSRT